MSEDGFIDAEAVRAAARETIARGGVTAPWVRAAIEEGRLSIEHATRSWTASHGAFSGHAVTLSVDAATLARAHAEAVGREVLLAALCGAASQRPNESIVDAVLRWDGTVVSEGSGYREPVRARGPATLTEAVRAWIAALAPEGSREIPEGLRCEGQAGHASVYGPRPPERVAGMIEEALRGLWGVRTVRWRG